MLGTREWDKYIFKIAKAIVQNAKDLNHVRCIKQEDEKVLIQDKVILDGWSDYFMNLLNETSTDETSTDIYKKQKARHLVFHRRASIEKIREAPNTMNWERQLNWMRYRLKYGSV